ncbi:MAG: adenylyl-sulfate kinase [Kofleriaceae bacterium]
MTAAGTVVWFTGLPQSGKSTLAARLRDRLAPTRTCIVLDSDELRAALGATEYGDAGRTTFYATLAALATLLARQGHLVLVAATAPRLAHRDAARCGAPRYLEVWVRTAQADCEARDVKGLYARARAGQAPALPGVGIPYEPPLAPDVVAEGGFDHHALTRLQALLGAPSWPAVTARGLHERPA